MTTKSNWRLLAVSTMAKNQLNRTFPLKYGKNRVGRTTKFDIPIPSLKCSRHHCSLFVEDDKVRLVDHVSTMKLIVNLKIQCTVIQVQNMTLKIVKYRYSL